MSATQNLLRFGVFELNLDTEDLRKSGTVVKLPPQPLRLLALLAGRAGQVVTRTEIQEQLWGEETYVDFDHGVNKCINQIRTALGDSSENPVYVETLPRHGYRFVAPVVTKTLPAPQPKEIESDPGQRSRPPVLITSRTKATAAAAEPEASDLLLLPDEKPAAGPVEVVLTKKPQSKFSWIGLAVLLVVAAAIGGALYWRWRAHKAPVLTDKDTIVLADFDNKTGDPVFDDTLKQGLAIQLEQSPFLNLISQSKIIRTLKLMERPADATLTPEVAREVCQRTGSKAMLTGSIASLGSQFVIGLKAVNCESGDVLMEVQEQAPRKEAVLKALDAAAITLRSKLGESLGSVQKYATPLEEATTPSLEALQAFSQALKTVSSKGLAASIPFFQRAVELDPNFALAYASVAAIYKNLNEAGLSAENARKAYVLREKVSERERFRIEAYYLLLTTGELEKAAQSYESWQQAYPRDYQPYANLGYIYDLHGQFDRALKQYLSAVRVHPNDMTSYVNLAGTYADLNRLEEAEVAFKEAEVRGLNSENLLSSRYLIAFAKGDTAQMQQAAQAAIGKPGTEDLLLATQADTEAWHGRLHGAGQLTRRAMDSALRNGAKETAATYQAAATLRLVESGYRAQARVDANAALKLAPNRDVRNMAALALARAGDTSGAERLVADLDREFPLDTIVQNYWLPTIRAAIALERKDPNRAVELLKQASTVELGQPTQIEVYLCPAYLRGEAYLMLHNGSAAAAEFQKFIDHYGLVMNFPWGALARLGLARAYALQAETDPAARDKARAAYQSFLTLWKDADPDITVLIQAKNEYRRLQ